MCSNYFNTEYIQWWPEFYKKNIMSVQSYGIAVPRTQKVNFYVSQYYVCEYSCQRPGEVISTYLVHCFITNNLRLLYVANKTLDLPNKKTFPNGMCPVN
jgi:hypothetical protein